jgi:hypothetical protein
MDGIQRHTDISASYRARNLDKLYPFSGSGGLRMHPDESYGDPASPIQRWNGATPLVMTGIVFVMVVMDLIRYGFHAPRHDESTAEHVAMLLMFGQIPIIISFLWSGRKEISRIATVLIAQVAFWLLTYVLALQ